MLFDFTLFPGSDYFLEFRQISSAQDRIIESENIYYGKKKGEQRQAI
jgi:hypothetical protein